MSAPEIMIRLNAVSAYEAIGKRGSVVLVDFDGEPCRCVVLSRRRSRKDGTATVKLAFVESPEAP